MNLNEAIETLNHIVKENPDKKTGLYTACDVVATHICKNATIDKEIKLDTHFSAKYKVVEVEEEYYNGTLPIREINLYLLQVKERTLYDETTEEPYIKKEIAYVNRPGIDRKDRIKIYCDYVSDRNFKVNMQFAKDVSKGLLSVVVDC